MWYRKLKDSWSAEPPGTCGRKWLWARRRGGQWVPSSSQATPSSSTWRPLSLEESSSRLVMGLGPQAKRLRGLYVTFPRQEGGVCFLEALPACANTPELQL